MTIPLTVRPSDAIPGAAPTFTCTMCGDCCRNFRQSQPRAPGDHDALAPHGLYPIATFGGLPTWSWERRRLLRESTARGIELPFVPSLLVLDERLGPVALLYALDVVDCPFLAHGPTEGTLVCGAYEARPLVCRAFPVVASAGAIAPSSKCPDIVAPAEASVAEFERLYGSSYDAASSASRVTARVAALLAFLESAGALRLVRGLSQAEAAQRVSAQPVADLWDVVETCSALDPVAWWRSLQPDATRVVTPAP